MRAFRDNRLQAQLMRRKIIRSEGRRGHHLRIRVGREKCLWKISGFRIWLRDYRETKNDHEIWQNKFP